MYNSCNGMSKYSLTQCYLLSKLNYLSFFLFQNRTESSFLIEAIKMTIFGFCILISPKLQRVASIWRKYFDKNNCDTMFSLICLAKVFIEDNAKMSLSEVIVN